MANTIKIGNLDISSFKVGGADCSIYLGDVKLYPQNNLPYDAEIEYLESTGTQWIDLPFNATSTLVTNIKFAFTDGFVFDNTSFLFGIYDISNVTYCVAIPSINQIRIPDGEGFKSFVCNTMSYETIYTLSYKFGSTKLDGAQISTSSGVFRNTSDYGVGVFGRKNSKDGITQCSRNLRVYGFSLIDNNNTVCELIPVVKNGVGYMYDKVSGQLFGNAGTGNFILGPDKN